MRQMYTNVISVVYFSCFFAGLLFVFTKLAKYVHGVRAERVLEIRVFTDRQFMS